MLPLGFDSQHGQGRGSPLTPSARLGKFLAPSWETCFLHLPIPGFIIEIQWSYPPDHGSWFSHPIRFRIPNKTVHVSSI